MKFNLNPNNDPVVDYVDITDIENQPCMKCGKITKKQEIFMSQGEWPTGKIGQLYSIPICSDCHSKRSDNDNSVIQEWQEVYAASPLLQDKVVDD